MNYQRDGFMALHNQGGAPNYYPNSFSGPQPRSEAKLYSFKVSGEVDRHDQSHKDDYAQAKVPTVHESFRRGSKGTILSGCSGVRQKRDSDDRRSHCADRFEKVNPELRAKLTVELAKYGVVVKPVTSSL